MTVIGTCSFVFLNWTEQAGHQDVYDRFYGFDIVMSPRIMIMWVLMNGFFHINKTILHYFRNLNSIVAQRSSLHLLRVLGKYLQLQPCWQILHFTLCPWSTNGHTCMAVYESKSVSGVSPLSNKVHRSDLSPANYVISPQFVDSVSTSINYFVLLIVSIVSPFIE